MKGFRFQLKKELRVGLNPSSIPMRNGGALSESMNIRVTNDGIEGYVPKLAPLPTVVSFSGGNADYKMDWPFPQIYMGPTYMWIGHRLGIDMAVCGYMGYPLGTQWVSMSIGALNAAGSWPWTFCELPGYFYCMCSGDMLFFHLPDTGSTVTYAVNDNQIADAEPWDPDGFVYWGNPLSVCFFRGQILLAGNRAFNIMSYDDLECRSVRWSSIGTFKFLGSKDGSGTYDRAVIPDAGQLILPNGAKETRVYRLLPLRDHVVCYCSNSIVILTPRAEPVPTFQVRTLAPVGVAGVYSAAGGEDYHVFVDRIGNLWTLTNDLKLTKVGYQDIFQDMQGHRSQYTKAGSGVMAPPEDWVEDPYQYYYAGQTVAYDGKYWRCLATHVSYTAPDESWAPGAEVHPPYTWYGEDYLVVWEEIVLPVNFNGYLMSKGMLHMVYNPAEDETYISDGIRSFIFSSDKALTETSRCVTSLFDVRNVWSQYMQQLDSHVIGVWKDTGERWAYFATDILNMNNNMIKTLESADLDGDIPDGAVIEMCADWRPNRKAPWRRTDWKRVNPKGVGTLVVSGVEFRVCVRVRPFDGFVVDSISIAWKQSDRSQIRGAYAVANDASANSGG